jgi:NAD(P)-dependent dehydrogenase (short-subunit alcohol dehydrogenase family)
MNNQEFRGKVAVITGSSRGIGKAIALELARRGAYIVLNGRNETRLEQAEKEIRSIQNRVISVKCDVSTVEGGKLLVEEAIRAFDRIDILVNNSGISMRGAMKELNPEVFRTVFESNLMGSVCPAIAALPYLRASRGSLVFISSLAGIRGLPFFSAYSASKMALRAIAESLRIEEGRNHLHIGLIYVGFTENEPGKETVGADGSLKLLKPRPGNNRVQSRESVAKAVVSNLEHRKFITVLTPLGKLLWSLQPLFPGLVESIMLINLKKFEAHNI